MKSSGDSRGKANSIRRDQSGGDGGSRKIRKGRVRDNEDCREIPAKFPLQFALILKHGGYWREAAVPRPGSKFRVKRLKESLCFCVVSKSFPPSPGSGQRERSEWHAELLKHIIRSTTVYYRTCGFSLGPVSSPSHRLSWQRAATGFPLG